MRSTRLTEFLQRMDRDAVAVFVGGRDRRRNGDTDFEFRQDTDFFYLTRLNEPDCVAVLSPSHPEHKYVLFVRPRVREEEIWTGIRTGVEGAVADYGADAAFEISRLDEVLPQYLHGRSKLYYRLGHDEAFDHRVIGYINRLKSMIRSGADWPTTITDPGVILHEMRLRKDDADLRALRRAAEISAAGHVAAMQACRLGMYEYELEAVVEYTFHKMGAPSVGYPSIVGAGFNTTILHYNTNRCRIKDGDLVLIDAGAEYDLYSGDITRTFPANGRFTREQQAVYEAVLAAQKEVIRMVAPGVSFMALHERAVEVVTDGLIGLGLLEGEPKELIEKGAYRKFFMHRTGHWLGMDVHDVGRYRVGEEWRVLEPGMVFTVEPGVYIAEGTEGVAEAFYNIGVRIEDDVVVTETGCEVLTSGAPKEVAEVEATMKQRMQAAG
ncbi:MAG: aminopeptidase P N-terminal domain-containing protein [Acidobacteria bacterium]|nr:aminopeptidase P N-terminal domain-containing protein [Acidobacteriota bacterium]MCW5970700.1 aminopeptidase P N-terminal domain-containing protein [Blastocatellales bacterium]